MNSELPLIPDTLLLELAAVITTLEALRKARGLGPITEESRELNREIVKLLKEHDAQPA